MNNINDLETEMVAQDVPQNVEKKDVESQLSIERPAKRGWSLGRVFTNIYKVTVGGSVLYSAGEIAYNVIKKDKVNMYFSIYEIAFAVFSGILVYKYDQLLSLNEVTKVLQKDEENLNAQNTQFQEANEKLQTELEEIKKTKTELEEQIENLNKAGKSFEKEIESLKNENLTLKNQIVEFSKENEKLQQISSVITVNAGELLKREKEFEKISKELDITRSALEKAEKREEELQNLKEKAQKEQNEKIEQLLEKSIENQKNEKIVHILREKYPAANKNVMYMYDKQETFASEKNHN